jgi:prepilin peptidase CpaA
MFRSSTFEMTAGVVYLLLLVWAGATDVRSRCIPNYLVIATAGLGIAYAVGHAGWLPGMRSALMGIGLGLVIWLPCYAMRLMGAGDVKFFAAASSWLGPLLVFHAALLSALFGGVLAVGWMIRSRARHRDGMGAVIGSEADARGGADSGAPVRVRSTLPYGVAMAAGIGVVAWFPSILR